MVLRQVGLLLGLSLCACGKLADESDAGDAAPDSADDTTDIDANGFPCGEGSTFVLCHPGTQFCLLTKTSKTHAYQCIGEDDGPPVCSPPVSSPGDCGCYTGPDGEIFITICQ